MTTADLLITMHMRRLLGVFKINSDFQKWIRTLENPNIKIEQDCLGISHMNPVNSIDMFCQ